MGKRIMSLFLVFIMTMSLIGGITPVNAVAPEMKPQMICTGDRYTVAIKTDGSLWTWGAIMIGQKGEDISKWNWRKLGDGTSTFVQYKDVPTPAKVMDNVKAVSASYHTAVIKTDGSLWTWGYNGFGQLGDGTKTDRYTPTKVMEDVVAVSAGDYHTVAMKSDGSLWTWGSNEYGQLGNGTKTDKYTPTKLMDHVVAVSAGDLHTAIIKTDGSLWTWGSNYSGGLGDGTTINRNKPVKVMDHVAAVAAGNYHTAAIKTDGSLWTWGFNEFGTLGDGKTTDRYTPVKVMDHVVDVSIGGGHTAAIKTDGSLWTWGYNELGALGDGTTTDRHSPVKVTDHVTAVSAGSHTVAIKNDGSLWTWGWNVFGQLGDGTKTDKNKPIKILQIGIPQDGIKVLLDNQKLNFDQSPITKDGRTLLPLRKIFESMGAIVHWDGATKTISATKGDIAIKMQIDNRNMSVNGKTITLDVPPTVVNNIMFVPTQAVAEGLRAGVDWDGNTKTVYITSDFYNLNVNNLVKNKAFSIFINPISTDGHKVWEYNYKDDLNMTEKQYKNYVYLATTGSALLETGVDISKFDIGDMFGNNNQREYFEDSITRLLIPTEEETKTLLQKNLESIAKTQAFTNDTVISIGSDIIDIYKEFKGSDFNYNKFLQDVGGKVTDKGLSIGLSTVNDTITELMLLKTIADTYDIIGKNYEEFINHLSDENTASSDKALIVEISKNIISKNKRDTTNQIITTMISVTADNTVKEAMKWIITNGIAKGAEKITYLKGTIALTITKLLVSRQIESSKSWLAFAGMNSIQKLAAKEYEILLNQAKNEKAPISTELQTNLKNAALVYTMSSIKCRNLLLTTVEKSQIIPNATKIEPLKNNLGTRNDIAYGIFETWKKAQVKD